MKQSTNTDSDQDNGLKSKKGRIIIYAVLAAIVAVVAVVLYLEPSGPSITIAQNASVNSTQIYMSPSQVESLLGSPLSSYNTYDAYSHSAPLNMSDLASLAPQLVGNATSGWVTLATRYNATSNDSLAYVVVTTSNTSRISKLLGSTLLSSLNITPGIITPGFERGLNYTYSAYSNSTFSFQLLYGWKGSNAALLLLQANTSYLANETKLINIAANDTPLH